MDHGRKIPYEYENPIDNIIIAICEKVGVYLHNLHVTPNIVTATSLGIGIIAVIILYYNISLSSCIVAAILFLIAYILDCLDGNMARKYNQVTVFGDYFDHISDLVKLIGIIYIVLTKLPLKSKFVFLISFSILQFGAIIHLGCQEKVYEKIKNNNETNNWDTLTFTKSLCPCKECITYTRYIGVGTLMTFIVLFILFIPFYK